MGTSSKEAILLAATGIAQAHGYGGMNYRDLAEAVGIKASSIYHHFPSKADLAAAVAKRYWEIAAANLEAIAERAADPVAALRAYPSTFRQSLENDNRLCLGSFMSAEHDDLPDAVRQEVQAFADVNIAWLSKMLTAAGLTTAEKSGSRARAIFASVAGAQLMARSRTDIKVFDGLIQSYREAGLLPT